MGEVRQANSGPLLGKHAYPDVVGAGEEHHESVYSHAPACRWRQPILHMRTPNDVMSVRTTGPNRLSANRWLYLQCLAEGFVHCLCLCIAEPSCLSQWTVLTKSLQEWQLRITSA